MNICVLFDSLGPYHIHRLQKTALLCNLSVVEQSSISRDYQWDSVVHSGFKRTTLFDVDEPDWISRVIKNPISAVLETLKPDVVVAPGWASFQAVSAVFWSVKNGVPLIIMSDSQEIDFRRNVMFEWVKSRFISSCSAAFVAGKTHREYIEKLGFPSRNIRTGYDVVDNDYFASRADKCRLMADELREGYKLPHKYLLCSARFIDKKNIFSLIRAFSLFHSESDCSDGLGDRWHLVILGDGPNRLEIERLVSELNLQEFVVMPGFKQYEDLPVYYALASFFILPSTTEQWGLVVNEAMASGLPVLVSSRCGCAPDLVLEGVNGFTFDPFSIQSIKDSICKMVALPESVRLEMGLQSRRIIDNYTPETFARNLLDLAETVLRVPLPKASFISRVVLRLLLLKACMRG